MAMDPFFSARYRMLGFLGITVSFAPLLFRIRIWLIARFRSEPLPTAYPVLMKQAAKVLSMLIRNLLVSTPADWKLFILFSTGVLSN